MRARGIISAAKMIRKWKSVSARRRRKEFPFSWKRRNNPVVTVIQKKKGKNISIILLLKPLADRVVVSFPAAAPQTDRSTDPDVGGCRR